MISKKKEAVNFFVNPRVGEGLMMQDRLLSASYWVKETKKKRWPPNVVGRQELRLVDFFSGCGGLSLGAHIACGQLNRNLKIVLAADMWDDALEVYRSNFNKILEASTNVDLSLMVDTQGSSKLSKIGSALSESMGEVDVIVAGPPCQGHSDLNNFSRRDDPRNFLYTIPVAFAIAKKAKILLLENVPAVVHSQGKVVDEALKDLEKNGYSVTQFVADAQDFGLPQTRKRHVLIASRLHSADELAALVGCVEKRRRDVALWDFISDVENEIEDSAHLITKRSKISKENIDRISYLFNSDTFDLPNNLRPSCHRDKVHSYVSMYGRLHADRPAQTITSGFGSMGQGRFVHPTQPRMITAHEAARIQGFPDYFKFKPVKKITALREMIGNAVPPPLAAALLKLLLKERKADVTET